MMPFALLTSALITSYIENNITLLRSNSDDDSSNGGEDKLKDIETVFAIIMEEISKIEKTENSDVSYTKIIIGILVLMALFTLKTKIYRMSSCLRKKRLYKAREEIPLENITIQELNYNVIESPATSSPPPPLPPKLLER
uniref:Sf19 n=1 Tax=Spodoptera frugiperda nuclear polyhedrosis virus TaxID=10455 RepID=E9L611_NPVSF|nr:hypothetical protein [Spodoptera frugiperda multiple nucleopolyhedrovirus]AFH58977.1 hypothetical protein Sf19 [Spodoptera frugiperda multiple nucleopolyhedrovirus]QED40219.1 hypothetical protein [Spodoptera frugiperda multiple nucleopolyhedrovirus]QRN46131.1 Sf19 [Spodoptera frugiperda multiple nucleopolyhedrovirus]